MELYQLTIHELLDRLRAGETTSEAITASVFGRIAAVLDVALAGRGGGGRDVGAVRRGRTRTGGQGRGQDRDQDQGSESFHDSPRAWNADPGGIRGQHTRRPGSWPAISDKRPERPPQTPRERNEKRRSGQAVGRL